MLQLAEKSGEEWYINSSVENLSRCFYALEDFLSQESPDDAASRRALHELRARLQEIDPEAMADAPRRAWPAMLGDMEALS